MKTSILLTGTLLCTFANAYSQNIKSPNIVFILTDDQGYGDLRCNGNPNIHTPNIDKLERESFSFVDYHVATTSAPSRSGLMSGKYCNSVGVWHTVNGRSLLSLDSKILPQLLKEGGYTTGMFGKWHLGDYHPYLPQDRGFDVAFYHGGGGVGQTPDVWGNNYFNDTYYRNGVKEKVNGYCTDVWFKEATSFIGENKDKPFFCYIATNAPHGPHNVERKYSEEYKNNSEIPDPNYYGMVTNIDTNVGNLIHYLEQENLMDNTIIVFMTDNGSGGGVALDKDGFPINGCNANMRGKKGSNYEGGHRVPFIMRIPGNKNPQKIFALTSYIDVMPTFLDLCGLKEKIPANIDGQSLLPLLDEDKESERYCFDDTQRLEYLHKGRKSCVMYKKWRLVNENELYNITVDAGERNNLASKYPEMVKKMNEAYEKWWNESCLQRADKFEAIPVGAEKNSEVLLYAHDLHNDNDNLPAWDQQIVRRGGNNQGYWALNVKKSGKYRICLYRWEPSTRLRLSDSAPAKIEDWGNVANYKEGFAFKDFNRAEIFVNNIKVQDKKVDDKKCCVEFDVRLKEGECFLKTEFITKADRRVNSYYTTVTLVK